MRSTALLALRSGIPGFVLGFFLSLAAVGVGHAASFSADLTDTHGGQTRAGRLDFLDGSYRLEVEGSGPPTVVLFDGGAGTTYLLFPSERAYFRAGPNEVLARTISPFGTYAYYAKTKDVQDEGTEAIHGVPCTKKVVSGMGQVFAVAWWAPEFDFPLKVQSTLPERTMELRNLQQIPLDAALFTVPADWTLMGQETKPPPPEWAGQVAAAPAAPLPLERTLSEGEILRILPQAGRPIHLRAVHAAGETSAFTLIGFKDGQPLGSVSGNTMNLSPEQECSMVFTKGPDEAEACVIRVRTGSVTISAVLGE